MKKMPILVALLVLVLPALADLQVHRFTRVSVIGGVGTIETSSFTAYQGDKRSELDTVKMTGGVVGLLAGKPKATCRVTRLDRELIWDIFHPDRRYDERPVKLPPGEQPAGIRAEGSGSGTPDRRYRIVRADLAAKATGAQRAINGFNCTQYLITFELALEDTVTKKTVEQVMTTDLWTTPDTDSLNQARIIEAEFNRRYAEKSGVEAPAGDQGALGIGMLTMTYGIDAVEAGARLARVAAEMEKVKGYPIVTEVKWQIKPDSVPPDPVGDDEKPARELPTSVGGLGRMLGSGAAKAILKPSAPPAPDILFSSYTEVRAIDLAGLPEAGFEIPAGYSRVKK